MNFGILVWGHDSIRISKLQKKAFRIVSLSKYNAHTEPILKTLNLLKFEDIYNLQLLKFYYKYCKDKLPTYFQSLNLAETDKNHGYNMRNRNRMLLPLINREYTKRSIQYMVINILNKTSQDIKQKINTHSLIGFSNYIKMKTIEGYSRNCSIPDCYICRNQ